MAKKSIEEIKRELVWIAKKENVHSILIFGSYLSDLNPRDIDICIVTFGKPFSLEEYGELTLRHPNGYDFVVFEELPLYLKMEIINKHIILYSRDQYELYAVFNKSSDTLYPEQFLLSQAVKGFAKLKLVSYEKGVIK